jgi:hypothetical protein
MSAVIQQLEVLAVIGCVQASLRSFSNRLCLFCAPQFKLACGCYVCSADAVRAMQLFVCAHMQQLASAAWSGKPLQPWCSSWRPWLRQAAQQAAADAAAGGGAAHNKHDPGAAAACCLSWGRLVDSRLGLRSQLLLVCWKELCHTSRPVVSTALDPVKAWWHLDGESFGSRRASCRDEQAVRQNLSKQSAGVVKNCHTVCRLLLSAVRRW